MAQRLGQSPVNDQGLAVLADDDIRRLDVAVQYAPAMGVLDGVANVDESPEELVQFERPMAWVSLSAGSARNAAMAFCNVSPRIRRIA